MWARSRRNGETWNVVKVSKQGAEVWHELDRAAPPIGTPVHGAIDWDRRYQLMRTHTAMHILCGVIFRDYGASVTGGNMEPLKGRMDFEFETMRQEFVKQIEEKINVEVAQARPTRVQDSATRRSLSDSRSDPHQDQPAARRHRRNPHRRDRRAGSAGRWRHARGKHVGGRAHPRGRLQEQGQDQQAD